MRFFSAEALSLQPQSLPTCVKEGKKATILTLAASLHKTVLLALFHQRRTTKHSSRDVLVTISLVA